MKYLLLILLIGVSGQFVAAQTGGTFEIKQAVIAAGGGQNSAGGGFTVDGTIGQSLAGGFFIGAPFSAYNGFWTPEPLAPTAAGASVCGRVVTAAGKGIVNARIVLTATDSAMRREARSASFGFYCFENVMVGETYVMTVYSRRFRFSNPAQLVVLSEAREDVNFTADEN